MLVEQYLTRIKLGLGTAFVTGIWYSGVQLASCSCNAELFSRSAELAHIRTQSKGS